ncbi:MAG: acyl-CoA dehydrogenase family protein [Acidimicrobiales bacterium]
MEFELSEDQQALRDAARTLLDDHADPRRVREHLAGGAPYDPKLWEAMVDQGWLGVDVAEPAGGLGLSFVELAVLAEEVGRHNAPAPFLQSVLALGALGGTSWADPLSEGGAIGAVGWAPAGATRVLVPYAPVADVAVVVVGDEIRMVELSAGGRPGSEPAMDLTRCVGWVDLDVVDSQPLGGPDAASRLVDRAAAGYAAELLGGAARVLEMTTEYAQLREQFGQPIGAFQAVKHRCADMLVDVEGMRSVAYHAAWCVSVDRAGAGAAEASIAASTAKVWCSDAGRRVMASGLQVHGGIGFTWDHDLHLFLKRSQFDQVSFGDATVHRERLAGLLRARLDQAGSVI